MRENTKSQRPSGRRVFRRRVWGLGAVLAVVAIITLIAVFAGTSHRTRPQFASLPAHPDASLHGTIAYFGTDSCVTVVSASGRFAEQPLCLTSTEMQRSPSAGSKLIGPQLVWRTDGRLEVTMFTMAFADKGQPPTYSAGWQKVIDVRTGAITQTPPAGVPQTWNLTTRPANGPAGATLMVQNSSNGTGKVTITLTQPGRPTRTLLSAQGPGEYTYRLYSAFWSPDRQWIAADDGRILLITPGSPPVTRVVTDQLASGGFNDDPRRSNFAVTSADLLGR